MSYSFKIRYRERPTNYRTPSPPRDAYETFSSFKAQPESPHSKSWPQFDQKWSEGAARTQFQTSSAQKEWLNSSDGRSQPLNHISETSDFPSRNTPAIHQINNSQSALELFATLATTPNLGSGPFIAHLIQPSTGVNVTNEFFTTNTHDTSGDYHLQERPTKRSRSEAIEPSAYSQTTIRPATSHASHSSSILDTSMEDAELLLSFAKGANQPWPLGIAHPAPMTSTVSSDVARSTSDTQSDPISRSNFEASFPIHDLQICPTLSPSLDSKDTKDVNLSEEGGLYIPTLDVPSTSAIIPEQSATTWNSDAMTTNGIDVQPGGLPTEIHTDVAGSTPEAKTRVYKGWPKGKPRGPRQVPYAKRGTRRVVKQVPSYVHGSPSSQSRSVVSGTNTALIGDFFGGRSVTAAPGDGSMNKLLHSGISEPERPRSYSTSALASSSDASIGIDAFRRGKSVPPLAFVKYPLSTKPGLVGPLSSTGQSQTTLCAFCHSSKNPSNGVRDTWIACTACQTWFHQFCVGFKTEREARNVDKFFCKKCTPTHGPTTFVRKSSRAHASVDYAGLNEGKIRTSTDVPDHHYIKQFVEGTIHFQPETFPRMRPELVTSDYFERSGHFAEPVVIPAWMNPRPAIAGVENSTSNPEIAQDIDDLISDGTGDWFSSDFEYDCVADDGQDKLDMVIPQGLTVRRAAELYGQDEKVEVIDVKSQEGEDKRWSMRQWADYYEAKGEKPVRNVISLEVSQSKLGRLIRRPKVVRDLDLQDSVWPEEDTVKGVYPKVQFYCLMSVANCYTDFHIDFGGSSVYYHILSGKKTFFFIPPKKQHLKKYEEWCLSANQSSIFLGDETKECYRVDLSDGDTMLIPSGWIHAVWTPVDTLVIGGNFLTRLHYGMQIQINEIEKNTGVARKFRYPYFQKVLWCAIIRYLERDPLPFSVAQLLLNGQRFERDNPIYHEFDEEESLRDPNPETHNSRFYSQAEVEGWQDLLRYIFRTVMITLGKVQGVSKTTQEAVLRSMPKGHADYLEMAQTFAMWTAWKRGNEELPSWAYPDAVITEEESAAGEKKMSAAALKRLERQAAHEAFVLASGRRSSARQAPKDHGGNSTPPKSIDAGDVREIDTGGKGSISGNAVKQNNGTRPIVCESCRQRRRRCKHKEVETVHLDIAQRFGIKENIQSSTMRSNSIATTAIPSSSLKRESASPGRVSLSRRSTIVSVVINTPEAEARPALANEHRTPAPQRNNAYGDVVGIDTTFEDSAGNTMNMPSIGLNDLNQHDGMSNGALDNELSASAKRARTKACDECRKSKRRCIHDENGRIDPVKAQESPIPRGTHSSKRSRSDGDTMKTAHKRARRQSDGIGNTFTNMKLESGLEYDPHSHLPSPPIGDEVIMNTSEDYPRILYDPTHPPIAIDPELLKLEEEFSRSLSPSTFCSGDHKDSTHEQLEQLEQVMNVDEMESIGNARSPSLNQDCSIAEHDEKTSLPILGASRAHDMQILDSDLSQVLEKLPQDSDRQSRTPSLHIQTTSNDSLDASASLPSTPPMSPLTDLGPSSPPHSPGYSFQPDVTSGIKAESPPVPRQTPRQRREIERFSRSTFDVKAMVMLDDSPIRSASIAAMPLETFAKPTSGHKTTNSRSTSREVRAISHDLIGVMISNGGKICDEAEAREAQDIKLARELSEQDFGLRRRSR